MADFARRGADVFAINYNSIAKRSFNGNASALFKDSHHPNDAGHRDIGTALLPFVLRWLDSDSEEVPGKRRPPAVARFKCPHPLLRCFKQARSAIFMFLETADRSKVHRTSGRRTQTFLTRPKDA